MDTKKLYARACEVTPLDANGFLSALGSAVDFLTARYGDAVAARGREVRSALESLDDDCGVDVIFTDALLNYLLFVCTKDKERRTFAVVEADYAYRTLWRARAKELRVAQERW